MSNFENKKPATIPFIKTGDGNRVYLFIHGFLDAGRIWGRVIDYLQSDKTQTVTFDLPGMGSLLGDVENITIERYAADVVSVLEAVGKPVIIVAQSMGAQIAELVASMIPSQVQGLVLITPVPLPGLNAPEEMVAPFKALGGDLEAQRQVRLKLSPNLSSSDVDTLTEIGRGVTPAVVKSLVEAWNKGVKGTGPTSVYQGPVLVIRGDADPFVNADLAGAVAARFRNVVSATVKDGGHWVHFEASTEVAKRIAEFADGIKSPETAGDWKGAFAKKSASAFEQSFAENVVLEAATLNIPVQGRENVKNVMEAASKIYESLEFTENATQGLRQYVEWKAEAFGGMKLNGVTVITRNDAGLIANVAIHHRPLAGALQFSLKLGEKLEGIIGQEHFASLASLPTALRSAK